MASESALTWHCAVAVKVSHNPCTRGTSFGCTAHGQLWTTHGCRGLFNCSQHVLGAKQPDRVATVACGDSGSHHPALCSCNTTMRPMRRRVSSPFEGRILLYNRVGKCGSTSLEKLLEQLCHVVPFTFDGDAIKLRRAVDLLRAVPTAMHSQPCRILFGHGRYTPNPPHTAYINLVREPLSRWLSLHDFYASTGLKGAYGRLTPPNATKCILAASPGTAAGACVGAWDSSISKYMLTAEEEAGGQCNVTVALSRFELLLTLEQSSALLPHLLSLLVPASSSGGEDDVGINILLDGVERYVAQGVPPEVCVYDACTPSLDSPACIGTSPQFVLSP